VTTGSADVVVAVIDTGLDTTHPDLRANLWTNPGEVAGNGVDDDGNGFRDDVNGWNFLAGTGALSDPDGHGTHVSGTIGAVGNNGLGVVGVNWHVRIAGLRVGDETFDGRATLEALRYVVNLRRRGVNVVAVNASFGGDSHSSLFEQELRTASGLGVLFVAAAGNDAENADLAKHYPSSYPVDNVIAVASIHQGGALSQFSNWGRAEIDLAAPGTGVLSTVPGGGWAIYEGTSMAAPHVAGAAALVAAAEPALTGAGIRARLLATVSPEPALTGVVATGGRLNVRRALAPGQPRLAVAVARPAVRVVVLDRPGLPLALEAALLPDGGATPSASIAWEAEGAPGAAVFDPAAGAATRARFSAAGLFRVRARASAGALSATDAVTVLVGGWAPPSASLEGWWRFDEPSGLEALDASGNGRHGTIAGAWRTSGVLGGALDFRGTNSNVRASVPAFMPRVTISAWVRADGPGNSIFPRVLHMREGLLFFGLGPAAGGADGNRNTLKFALDDGIDGRVWHAAPESIAPGVLCHVAATFDSTVANAAPRLYLDGVALAASEQGGTAGAGPPSVEPGTAFIGDRGDGTRAWDGPIDEVRVYSRALGESEVALLAAEDRARPLAGGSVSCSAAVVRAGASATVRFDPAGGVLPAGASWSWAVADPAVAEIVSPAGFAATVRGLRSGTTFVEAAAVIDGVMVVASAPLEVAVPPGVYEARDGAAGVRLVVGDDGTAWFLAGGGGLPGVFSRRDTNGGAGVFPFVAADGTNVAGSVGADGAFSGTVGGVAFAGAATAQASGPAGAVYHGYALRTAVRAHALAMGEGTLGVVVMEPGGSAFTTLVRGSDGTFASFDGTPAGEGALGDGVFDGTVAGGPSGTEARHLVLVREGVERPRRLANLSARGFAAAGEAAMIAGFVASGETPVLLRAVGPGLEPFVGEQALTSLRLELFRGGASQGANERWIEAPDPGALAAAAVRLGAFALSETDADAALLRTVTAEPFTAHVSGRDGASGIALAEAYDASGDAPRSLLANLSARAWVGVGDEVLIGGFVVDGEVPQLVLVRAVGPALAGYAVAGFLADPVLEVYEGSQVIAGNDTWSDAPEAARIRSVGTAFGAFDLPDGSRDAALLRYLPPGSYTAIVRGAAGTTGVALVEIYRVSEAP
jgi:hypothetical protein